MGGGTLVAVFAKVGADTFPLVIFIVFGLGFVDLLGVQYFKNLTGLLENRGVTVVERSTLE